MANRGILKSLQSFAGYGVYKNDKDNFLYYAGTGKNKNVLVSESRDLHNFFPGEPVSITDIQGRRVNQETISAIRISRFKNEFAGLFLTKNGLTSSSFIAISKNLKDFKVKARVLKADAASVLVPDFKYNKNYVFYRGGENLKLFTSPDLKIWKTNKNNALSSNYGGGIIDVAGCELLNKEILVSYFETIPTHGKLIRTIGAAIFDPENPNKLIYRSKDPVWEQPSEWSELDLNIQPFGIIVQGQYFISYWTIDNKEIISIVHSPKIEGPKSEIKARYVSLKKHNNNPILEPIPNNFWESKATFNPAAIYDEGKVHIIYRAIGDHDISMLGYASSKDGIHIDERLKDPIYVPTQPFEFSKGVGTGKQIPLSVYASGGGGYGGVEDPRITKIGDKIYMTYVAYDGFGPPRVALTSIRNSDFKKKNWKWEKPVLISRPNEVNKNAVIFPEKIQGKYVIMHRVFPNILIDFVDSLDFDGGSFLRGDYKIAPSKYSWDNRKIGAGAPPIRVDDGWLLIYQAVGERESGRYKIGAMLLDADNPCRVIGRSFHPVLEPEEAYENEGFKSGVVYPCGAINKDDTLYVYYGGADTVTCCATADIREFVRDLKTHGTGQLKPVNLW